MSWFTTWNGFDQVLAWSGSVLIQVTLMATITLALASCLRRHSAMRYWLCCSGLGLIFLCPLSVLGLQKAGIGWLSVSLDAQSANSDSMGSWRPQPAAVPNAKQSPRLETSLAPPHAEREPSALHLEKSINHSAAANGQPEPLEPPASAGAQRTRGAQTASATTRPASEGEAAESQGDRPGVIGSSAVRMAGGSLLAIWLLSTAWQTMRLVVAWRRVAHLLASASLAKDARLSMAFAQACRSLAVEPGRVQLKTSQTLAVPIAAGWLRPVVVVPEHLIEQITSQQLQEVLMHEVAHVLRRDQVVVLFQNVVSAFYWFHPLVSWLNRQLAQAREEVCDNYVLAANDASSYSRTLLTVAELAGRSRVLPGTVGLFTARWKLEHRIGDLLDARRNRTTRLTGRARCLTGLSTLVVCLASLATIKLTVAQTPAPPLASTQEKAKQAAAPQTSTSPEAKRADAPQGNDSEFELRVVGPDSAPVPYADIEIRPKADPGSIRQGIFQRQSNYGTMVKANKEGILALVVQAKTPYSFFVELEGFGPYCAEWRNDARPPKFTVQLEAARAVGGVVVDEDGNPIAGAHLRPNIQFKKRDGDNSALGVGTRITTDEAGRWQYKNLPLSESSFSVEVTHPRFMPARPNLAAESFDLKNSDRASARIVMQRGQTVRGKVTDTHGMPVVGALVRTKFLNDIREAKTNDDGVYELVGCEPSVARIVVSAPGLATDMQTLRISEESLEPVDFVMQPGGHVRVRVIDENQQPIPKARIFFQRWREDRYAYFELDHAPEFTDENGVWEWNEAPLDEFQADICRPGGMQLALQPLLARPEEYVFSPPKALIVVGRVVDAKTKQPVPRFEVVPGVRASPQLMNWVDYEIFEGRDGTFERRITNDYFAHLFKVQAEGYLPTQSRDIKSDEGRVELTFELERGKDIDFVVAMPDGQPAVGAKIALGIPGSQININNGEINDGSTYAQRAVTGSDGRFRFAAQSTPYQLVVTHDSGFAHVTSDELADADRVELTPWAKATGVFRVAGKPVAGVVLYLNSGNVHSYGAGGPNIFTSSQVVTGEDGRFALERVFPGRGSVQRNVLRVVGEGAKEVTSSSPISTEFYAGETTEIDFKGAGSRVVGRLVAPENRDSKVIWAFADVTIQTHIALPPLPPPPAADDKALDPAKKAEVFRDWTATPEGRAWLDLQEQHRLAERSRRQYTATVATDGQFAIADVEAGDYILTVHFWEKPESGRIDKVEFQVTAEEADRRDDVDLGTLQLK